MEIIKYHCPNCRKQINARKRDDGVIVASCPFCKSNIVSKLKNTNGTKKVNIEITLK